MHIDRLICVYIYIFTDTYLRMHVLSGILVRSFFRFRC